MKLLENIKKPTPKKWRVIGNTLLAVGAAITAWGMYEEDSVIALIAGLSAVTGKFITNFFTEESLGE